MQIKSGLRQALLSAAVFCGVIAAVATVDARVRQHVEDMIYGGGGVRSWDNRAIQAGNTVLGAMRDQGIDNTHLMIFAAGGAVLFFFMFKA
jgi:hypothetical protein